MRVVDAACGEGYGSALLARTAASVVGADLSADAVAHARAAYAGIPNLSFVQAPCTKLPLEDASADLFISFETVEHIREQEAFLDEIARVLAPDGLLLLSCPNKREYSDRRGFDNEFHVKELYREELESLVARRFRHLRWYGQRPSFFSVIAPEPKAETGHLAEVSEANPADACTALDEPLYFLVAASRSIGTLGMLPATLSVLCRPRRLGAPGLREGDARPGRGGRAARDAGQAPRGYAARARRGGQIARRGPRVGGPAREPARASRAHRLRAIPGHRRARRTKSCGAAGCGGGCACRSSACSGDNRGMNPRLGLLKPYPFEKLRVLLAGVTPPPGLAHVNLSIGEPQHPTPAFLKDAVTAHLGGLARYPLTKGPAGAARRHRGMAREAPRAARGRRRNAGAAHARQPRGALRHRAGPARSGRARRAGAVPQSLLPDLRGRGPPRRRAPLLRERLRRHRLRAGLGRASRSTPGSARGSCSPARPTTRTAA